MNILGLIFSVLFVFFIILISTILSKLNILNEEGSRKFIHIGVGNWWLLAMYFFDNVIYASIVPILFIFLNYLSYRKNLFKAMERSDDKNLGTVYYPISLLILVIFTFGILGKEYAYVGAIGILIMAYGDGFAAIFGKRYGKKKIYQNKTLLGFLVMLLVSFIVTGVILAIYTPEILTNPIIFIAQILVVSISASLVELYSKKGLDNITVPLLSSLVYFLIALL